MSRSQVQGDWIQRAHLVIRETTETLMYMDSAIDHEEGLDEPNLEFIDRMILERQTYLAQQMEKLCYVQGATEWEGSNNDR